MRLFSGFAIFLTLLSGGAFAGTHLTLIGGGTRPVSALKEFNSNVKLGRPIWVLPWGTALPDQAFQTVSGELKALGAVDIRCSCGQDLPASDLASFESSGGFYFPGGNQNLIIEKLQKFNLIPFFQKKFQSGVPFAGTSAGTAIESDPMLTGDGSNLGIGLGLLQGFLVDQHFWVRQREPRLLGALEYLRSQLQVLKVGMGVDEGMAIQITDGTHLKALGPSRVSLYRWNSVSSKFEKKDLFDQDQIDVILPF